jgi:hypothetical protein
VRDDERCDRGKARTYCQYEEDVLGDQRSGFLWTAIESAGHAARNYGEFEYMEGKPPGTWQQYYCAAKSVMSGGDPAQLTSADLKGNYGSVIPSLNAIADTQSPPFDLSIPDIYRYEIWKQDFEQATAAAWQAWIVKHHTMGNGAVADYADPEQMNRHTWYQAHDWKVPYPGDTKMYLPSQVPGAYLPSPDTN